MQIKHDTDIIYDKYIYYKCIFIYLNKFVVQQTEFPFSHYTKAIEFVKGSSEIWRSGINECVTSGNRVARLLILIDSSNLEKKNTRFGLQNFLS